VSAPWMTPAWSLKTRNCWCWSGPSGCGKTTTLRLIAGLEAPTAGTIAINGQVVNDLPPKDRDIAMVFQNHALYPHMSVYENMAFGLKLRHYPKAEIDQRVMVHRKSST
jgi:multiple sugar transport system ATP-binding protein